MGWMPWLGREAIERPTLQGRPIILIHGFTQNRTNFVWLARVLRRWGLGPFFGFDYFSFDRVEESARELQRFV